jgi:uncharacterized protein YecE (DUF72 family)
MRSDTAARAPRRFLFAVKASRFLTHMKKLKDPHDPLDRFYGRVHELGPKLGPVLYQLPPRWKPNTERLAAFLDALPASPPQAMEFRESAWYSDAVLGMLERSGVALCLHDMPGSASPRLSIGPIVYVRFHGAEAKYRGGYPKGVLEDWADFLLESVRQGRHAYVYFNNDVGGDAPRDAMTLRELLKG